MNVLLEMQWVTSADGAAWPSQISAVRTEEFGWINEEFHALVRPGDPGRIGRCPESYCGYPPEEFLAAQSEYDVVKAFFDWLEPGDTLCCWTAVTVGALKQMHERWLGQWRKLPVVVLLDRVRLYLPAYAKKEKKLYDVAQVCGVELPEGEPSAKNCVYVLRDLFRKLEMKQLKRMPERERRFEEIKQERLLRRERNQKWMEKEPFAYIYLESSKVFHRCGCKVLLNSEGIRGCVRYEKAAGERRPCKLCNPVKDPELERRVSVRITTPHPKKKPLCPADWNGNEVITTFLLGSERIAIRRKKLVGCCHNHLHPGKLTEKLMKEHACLQKGCYFFEKYPNASYWINHDLKKEEKKTAKAQKMQKMERQQALQTQQELFQSYAEQTGSAMKILRVEETKKNVYTIFYVSENPFRDGNRFPDFLDRIRTEYPLWRLVLRHVQDTSGHFVTIHEYAQLRR